MAVRKDQVQINVSFITDESKAYAKLIESNKEFIGDLFRAKKTGEDVTATIRKMAAAAQGVQNTDLTQLVPAQLISRAKQLQQVLQFIPESAPEYAVLNGELKRINDRLATIRASSRGVAEGLGESAGKFQTFLQSVGAVVGGLSVDRILGSLVSFGKQLYQLGIPMDFFAEKTRTVFGDAESIVKDFAEQNALDLGLTNKEFVNLATSVGDLLVPIGFAKDEAAGFANEVTKQSGILSEWQGGLVSTQRAHEILTDAVLGERDGLKQLGIQIDEDLIKQELKAKGLDGLTGSSLRQAEALITLEQVTKQSAAANENFAKNSDSAVRAQAKLRATIQGITEDVAKGLRPAFAALLNILSSVVTFLAGFVRALFEIPRFVSENRVQVLALVVALVSLNAANIASALSTLRMAAVQKAQTIATTALTIAQRLLNVAMKANPVGLLITAISLLIAGLATAYQRSENFRAAIQGLGAIAGEVFKIIGESVKAFGSGFSKILKGDFAAGFKDIGDGLVKANPIGIALTQGERLKKAFTTGFEKSKLRDAQKKEAQELAKNKKPFEEAGAANGDAYGKAFARLAATGERDPKEAAKEAKEALDLQLKGVETALARQRVLVEQNRLDNKLSESEYQKQLLELQEREYGQQLEVYRKFGQAQTLEALELRKKLLQVQQDLQPNARIEVAPLGNRNSDNQVQSQTGAENRAQENLDNEFSIREQRLRDAFRNALILEEEYQIQSLELERNKIDRKLALLASASGKELEDKRALEEKKAEIDNQILDKQAEAAERRRKAEINGISAVGEATRDLVGTAAELLAQDQENRKKNANAIKAFQKAEIIIAGILEVQRIWANAAEYGPLAPVIGGIQTGIAVARSAFALSKVDKQKFGRGGARRFGIFGGKPHTRGGTKGVFDDGTQIEVERDELFAVVNKRSTGMLQALSRLNEAGGGIPFMRSGGLFHLRTGGLAAINTTPNRLATGGQGGFDIAPLMQQVDRMITALQTPKNIKANIVYSEYEATRDEVNGIQSAASI